MDVKLTGVTKSFGAMKALDDVGFEARAGAIHAVVGENGAGKTTLMRILYGALAPDAGTIEVDGAIRTFARSSEAIEAGIGMVSQHYSVIPELTCLQNLMLGAEPSWALSKADGTARAESLASKMGYAFDWHARADTLSPAGKQKLEILKLVWRESKVMILDEPTAMLSPADSEALFASLHAFAEKGACVIVVTHRLPEVMRHCETATVLRGGRLVGSTKVADTDASRLAESIVGHSVAATVKSEPMVKEPLFSAKGLTVKGYRGDDAVKGATFMVRSGEVVGLAGVDGNGQRELFQAVTGHVPAEGTLEFDGRPWNGRATRQRLADGLRLIPEDRHAEGVIDEWSLDENASLGRQWARPFAKGPWIDAAGRRTFAEQAAARFRTKHDGLDRPMSSLSGGNQQRFVAGRALSDGARLVLAFQPTRGLDIDGTAKVYGAIRDLCREGACALIVSFDLDELIEHCDRVLVISQGRLSEPSSDVAFDRAEIGRMMVEAG